MERTIRTIDIQKSSQQSEMAQGRTGKGIRLVGSYIERMAAFFQLRQNVNGVGIKTISEEPLNVMVGTES
jgi:hypothetical protein